MQAAGIGLLWMVLALGGEAVLLLKSGEPMAGLANAFTISAISSGELFAAAVLAVGVTPLLGAMILRPDAPP